MGEQLYCLAQRIGRALGCEPADLVIKDTRFLDVATGRLLHGDIAIFGDRIVGTQDSYNGRIEIDGKDLFAVPGFVDAHLHVESSLLVPAEFERCVLPRGTTTAICDPHEICNVLGREGLRYMLAQAENLCLDLRVQLPSCVPATTLETSGARLDADQLAPFLGHPRVLGLAELMNFPGVIERNPEVLRKLAIGAAHVDGHAPLLRGHALNAYLAAGIRTCHESTTVDEATEKLSKGMEILVREGSAAKDTLRLAPVLDELSSPFIAFCTDDRHVRDILGEGHIDHCIRTAISAGAPIPAVYRAASWSAARAFGLCDRGRIAPGFRADLVLLGDMRDCAVEQVICGGRIVDDELLDSTPRIDPVGLNSIRLDPVTAELFAVPAPGASTPVIGIVPDRILTRRLTLRLPYRNGRRHPDPDRDVQKLCVLARHGVNRNIGRGFVKGLGIRCGALASSVAHDSHNIIVAGIDDADMAIAVNRLIELQGGLVAVRNGRVLAELALPVAGLMSECPAAEVRDRLNALVDAARLLGCTLREPFLQLAFLALPVVPHLKLTDRGLVDVDRFALLEPT